MPSSCLPKCGAEIIPALFDVQRLKLMSEIFDLQECGLVLCSSLLCSTLFKYVTPLVKMRVVVFFVFVHGCSFGAMTIPKNRWKVSGSSNFTCCVLLESEQNW